MQFSDTILVPGLIGSSSSFKMFECTYMAKTILDLIQRPLEINEMGMTSLHYAALYGCADGILECLSMKIDPNILDCLGRSALYILLARQTLDPIVMRESARTLLEGGADPNVGFEDDMTSLMLAVLTGDVDLVHLLCKYGASIDARFNTTSRLIIRNKSSALSLAVQMDNVDMVRCLVGYLPLPNTVFHALQQTKSSVMRKALVE